MFRTIGIRQFHKGCLKWRKSIIKSKSFRQSETANILCVVFVYCDMALTCLLTGQTLNCLGFSFEPDVLNTGASLPMLKLGPNLFPGDGLVQ